VISDREGLKSAGKLCRVSSNQSQRVRAIEAANLDGTRGFWSLAQKIDTRLRMDDKGEVFNGDDTWGFLSLTMSERV